MELAKKITDIPEVYLNDISFMLGSIEESSEYLSDILKKHGYDEKRFGFIDVNDDEALTVDVYNTFIIPAYITGKAIDDVSMIEYYTEKIAEAGTVDDLDNVLEMAYEDDNVTDKAYVEISLMIENAKKQI